MGWDIKKLFDAVTSFIFAHEGTSSGLILLPLGSTSFHCFGTRVELARSFLKLTDPIRHFDCLLKCNYGDLVIVYNSFEKIIYIYFFSLQSIS